MRFPGPELPRFAIVTALTALVAIAAGALMTSGFAGPALLFTLRPHSLLAILSGAMAVVLLVWLIPSNTPAWVRGASGVALGLFAANTLIAVITRTRPLPIALSVAHACIAPLFFSALVVVAAYTWPGWEDTPTPIDLHAYPFIAQLADAAPWLTLLQIGMGAAYRHQAMSVMPHVAGAMLVALPLLIVSVLLLQQFPKHPTVPALAISTMTVLLLQVSLGIGTFVVRLLDFDATPGFAYLAAAHLCAGALTLAASVIMCIEVRRCRPRTISL